MHGTMKECRSIERRNERNINVERERETKEWDTKMKQRK
jgi:hypothetical protein